MPDTTPLTNRRWFQFGLGTLFVVLGIATAAWGVWQVIASGEAAATVGAIAVLVGVGLFFAGQVLNGIVAKRLKRDDANAFAVQIGTLDVQRYAACSDPLPKLLGTVIAAVLGEKDHPIRKLQLLRNGDSIAINADFATRSLQLPPDLGPASLLPNIVQLSQAIVGLPVTCDCVQSGRLLVTSRAGTIVPCLVTVDSTHDAECLTFEFDYLVG